MKSPTHFIANTLRDRRAVAVLGVGGISLVILLGLYGYVFGVVSAKAQHAADLLTQYDSIAGKDTRQTTLRIALRDTEPQIQRLDTFFLHGDAVSQSQFVNMIESIGTQIGVDAHVTGLNERSSTVLTVDLEAIGSFAHVMQLVDLIKLLPYKISITKVYLSFEGAGAGATDSGGAKKTPPAQALWKTVISFNVTSYLQQP